MLVPLKPQHLEMLAKMLRLTRPTIRTSNNLTSVIEQRLKQMLHSLGVAVVAALADS